jgi:hypothetical protein
MKDTAAWHVIEQMLKHAFGLDDMDDDEIVSVSKLFRKAGGKWRDVMSGDRRHVEILEECIGNVLEARRLQKIAVRVAGARSKV